MVNKRGLLGIKPGRLAFQKLFRFPGILQTRQPFIGLYRQVAPHAFGKALNDEQAAGQRDQGLEVINLNTGRAVPADFLISL